jgi:hypothetical protein
MKSLYKRNFPCSGVVILEGYMSQTEGSCVAEMSQKPKLKKAMEE